MTKAEITELAGSLGYTVEGTLKAELIESFLTAQNSGGEL